MYGSPVILDQRCKVLKDRAITELKSHLIRRSSWFMTSYTKYFDETIGVHQQFFVFILKRNILQNTELIRKCRRLRAVSQDIPLAVHQH